MHNTKDRRMNKILGALTIVMFVVGVVAVVLIVAFGTKTEPFQPLTYETVKVVRILDDGAVIVPQVKGVAAPSINVSDGKVPFLMNRCSDATEEKEFLFRTEFIDVAKDTRYVFSVDGTKATILPGCDSVRFTLELPRDLVADVVISHEIGDIIQYRVEGTAIATQVNGATESFWTSETFNVIYDEVVITGDTGT